MLRSLRTILFISVLLSCISAKPKTKELCHLITSDSPDREDTSITELAIDKLSVIQSSCVQYFSLNLKNPLLENKYVTVELKFHDLPNVLTLHPKFLYRINSKPTLYFNYQSNSKIQVDANGTDENAFFNRKAYHHIVLTPEDIKRGGISFFAVYKASSAEEEYFGGSVRYDINIKTSDIYPCPQDCSGNGICDQKQKKCICDNGFFDLDCSVQAVPLVPSKVTTDSIEGQQWGYFYLRTESELEDIKLNVAKSGGRVRFSLLMGDVQNFFLPNFYHSEGSYTLTPEQNNIELSITRPLLSGNEEDRQVIVGVYNVENEPVTVGIEVGLYDPEGMTKTTILFSIAGILLGLAAFLATLVFFKYRYPRLRTWTNGEEQNAQKTTLTKEEVEKYFPENNFKDFKSSFSQTLCSICLEDFTEESSCRQLYCEHVYHGDCIDAWVMQHENCPNCKKIMTKQAIEAHLNKAKPDQNTNKQINIECSHTTVPTPNTTTTNQPDNEQEYLLDVSEISSQ